MEYFDFEHASHAPHAHETDDFSSTGPPVDEDDASSCFGSLFIDGTNALPAHIPANNAPTEPLCDTSQVEYIRHEDDPEGAYPIFRAKEPCDLCRQMGLNCYFAPRGALLHGCTCCISLFRECSFTHRNQRSGPFLNTLGLVTEDVQADECAIAGKKALRSLGGPAFDETRPRKNGARFSREAVKALKNWLTQHARHPYPTDREKDELKQLTGLKRSQISNWLANARRRGKVRPTSTSSSPILGAINIPRRPANQSANVDMQSMSPLERWKQSPPEHEAASATAIARAVAQSPIPSHNTPQSSLQNSCAASRASSRRSSSNDSSAFSMFRAPSASSFETGTNRSSASDVSLLSNRSHRSQRSSLSSSFDAKDRRRRRRAPIAQRVASTQAKPCSARRIFQCTFCTDTFPAKYDWARHEKSLHLALERWTCCPARGTLPNADGHPVCVFCQIPNPTSSHLEAHNFASCQEKTLQERTFYRKDHLRQHLKLLHSCKFQSTMESWKSTTSEIKSKCGFCPHVFSTWQQRTDHLAAHFRNGSDMSSWHGAWGFETYVERLVENSIPPYLIAQERRSMDPWVARPRTGSGHGAFDTMPSSVNDTNLTFGTSAPEESVYNNAGGQMSADSNCWRRLEQELSKFIAEEQDRGVTPSDRELQNRARMIVFGDDDPWNQTCVDNQLWLGTFKAQHGIGGAGAVAGEAETRGRSEDVSIEQQKTAPRLEELPIMPPYVVRGGLRQSSRGGSAPALVPGADTKETGIATSSPNQSLSFTTLRSSSEPSLTSALDMDIDINFDGLDFSNLDLGILDDVAPELPELTSASGVGPELFPPATAAASNGGIAGTEIAGPGIPQPQAPQDQNMAALQFQSPAFGEFEMHDARTWANDGFASRGTRMSENDLRQLSAYMAGFQ